jgi:hypothetical protein
MIVPFRPSNVSEDTAEQIDMIRQYCTAAIFEANLNKIDERAHI